MDARVVLEQTLDLGAERVELRRPRPALVARWRIALERATDRRAVKPGAALDLVDREPLDELHAPDLRPLLHADHCSSSLGPKGPSEGQDPARRTDPPAEARSLFNRRRWISIQAVP